MVAAFVATPLVVGFQRLWSGLVCCDWLMLLGVGLGFLVADLGCVLLPVELCWVYCFCVVLGSGG